jgi:hypothetical protein
MVVVMEVLLTVVVTVMMAVADGNSNGSEQFLENPQRKKTHNVIYLCKEVNKTSLVATLTVFSLAT